MEKFAKLFETELGQVLVMNTTNDDETNVPEVKLYFTTNSLGVCNMGIKFNEGTFDAADKCFDEIDEEKATEIIRNLYVEMGIE